MTVTPLDVKLGRAYRLYAADKASPANDADYDRVTNENDLNFNTEVNTTDLNMKENNGQVATTTGAISYEITAEAARVYTDTGLVSMLAAKGKNWNYQIRYVDDAGLEKVYVEGVFLLTQVEQAFGADGAATLSFTLKGAGSVTENATPRALVNA